MKTLYLLRHAHAENTATSGGGDHERPLSATGQAAARQLGNTLRGAGRVPDITISSSAIRTVQTGHILLSALLAMPGEHLHETTGMIRDRTLYNASADHLLTYLHGLDDTAASALIIAHNPGIADLAHILSHGRLADYTLDYAPCTLTHIEADVANWHDLSPRTTRIVGVYAYKP